MLIKEIQLLADDPDGTIQFYNEILGLKILSSDHTRISFSAGSSVLTFLRSEDTRPFYHFAFNIPWNQFEAAMDWVGSKLKLIEVTPGNAIADFKSWNAKAFYFFDNNQNIVEMIARFDVDNASLQPFNGSSIYSVSEIGAVVESPMEYAQELNKKYQLEFFPKQKPANDFIAVGDDHGLFIIVPQNRKWYPTNIRSAKHWAKLTIEVSGKDVEITL
ncbi:MAG: hypothetical protein JWP81_2042 [Ferruginibacter sp.]|nr:hypothetical protein [Ferruginibacter sp.]